MIDYTFARPTNVTDQAILDLYRSNGWTAYTEAPQNTLAAFQQSTVLWALASGRLVGFVRGITDGHTILYIQDILVHPDFQRQHIGTALVRRYLQRHQHIGQTVLITDDERRTRAFYQSIGFSEVRPQDDGRAFVLDRRFN
ncbi:GNAT family N-acetyltransferase [Levilactobacillus spicheri]|uniref:GNAT family N-acetyltransferase n=1 Tax=Levilactobacillus spicheri TaxID=216463 RepID=UPI0007054E02|nr:GNAT family N-acetyltransferase [Levilactobacillus spicheri]